MGLILKISKKSKPEAIRRALSKLSAARSRNKPKTLADYYGAGTDIYEDGLTYQKKQRDEWQ